MGTLGHGRQGRESLGNDIYWLIKAVASPAKLFFPILKGITFK